MVTTLDGASGTLPVDVSVVTQEFFQTRAALFLTKQQPILDP